MPCPCMHRLQFSWIITDYAMFSTPSSKFPEGRQYTLSKLGEADQDTKINQILEGWKELNKKKARRT